MLVRACLTSRWPVGGCRGSSGLDGSRWGSVGLLGTRRGWSGAYRGSLELIRARRGFVGACRGLTELVVAGCGSLGLVGARRGL